MAEFLTNQVNISIDNETLAMLIKMVEEDGESNGFANRSAFIRQLIRSENKRRSEERYKLTSKGKAQLEIQQDKQAGQ